MAYTYIQVVQIQFHFKTHITMLKDEKIMKKKEDTNEKKEKKRFYVGVRASCFRHG